MQAESSTESALRSSAVLFDNPAYSAQASPERASTADSGLRRSRLDAAAGGSGLLLSSMLAAACSTVAAVCNCQAGGRSQ